MGKELLLVAEAVSNEKGVGKDIVFEAIQAALESATRKKHGAEYGIRVALDPESGEYDTFRYWEVVNDEDLEFPDREIPLSVSKEKHPDLDVSGRIEEPMESVAFGRIAAQAAKQVILQKVREAERNIVVSNYEGRVGELLMGLVKKTTRDFLLLDMGANAEAMLPRSEMLPQEIFRPGDRVRAFLYDVTSQPRGPQLFVSRRKPQMLMELFKIEVPEIAEDIIEIKGAVRDPGVRAKVAVKTNDGRIDPVGACVGMRGSRVQAVSAELGGERIDVFAWDDNPAKLVINALDIEKYVGSSIMVDDESKTMDLAIPEEHLSKAIGKNGQNIRLASELTGWTLNVMNEDDYVTKTQEESKDVLALFQEKLDVDSDVAQVLVDAGFVTIEEIAFVPVDELKTVEGFDEDVVMELRNRANDVLLESALTSVGQENTPEEDLLALEGMTDDIASQLAQKGIKSAEDLAECAVDELLEIESLDENLAGKLIMKAREPWFAEEVNN